MVGACVAWMIVIRRSIPVWSWAIVILGAIVVLAWLAMFARSRRRLRSPERHLLRLDTDALVLVEGASERRAPWEEVETIGVDEDRLVVRIELRGAEPLSLEPRYGRLGVYDLEAAIRRAHEAARTKSVP